MLRKSLVIFFLGSVAFLNQNASSEASLLDLFEITQIKDLEGDLAGDIYDSYWYSSDTRLTFINDQIMNGCSDEFFQQVLQLPENDEYSIIFKDIFKVACLWDRDIDQSLDLFKELQSRINKDSDFYGSYNEKNDTNYRLIYFYNLVVSVYPYYFSNNGEEFFEWLDEITPFYQSLIRDSRFRPFDFISAQYFTTYVIVDGLGSAAGLRRVRENIERTIFSMISGDQKLNDNLAYLLLENRVDMIRDLSFLDEYELLAGELSDFNKIYFQNFEDGFIQFTEFENYMNGDLSISNEFLPDATEEFILWIDPSFIFNIDPFVDVFLEIFQREIFFPQRDEALEGYLNILNYYADERIDALLSLTSLMNSALIYNPELLGFSKIRAENICEKVIGIEQRELNFSEGMVYGEAPTDFDIDYAKLQIEEIKLGCNFDEEGKSNYLNYLDDFINQNIYLFKENGYQLSSEDSISSSFRDIFSRLLILRIDTFFGNDEDNIILDKMIVDQMDRLTDENIFLIDDLGDLYFAQTYFLQAAVLILSESGLKPPNLIIQFKDDLFEEEYLDTLNGEQLKDFINSYTSIVSSSFFQQFMDLEHINPINTDDPEWERYRDRHLDITDNLNAYIVERFGYLGGGGLDWLMPREIQQTFQSIQLTYLFLMLHETIQALNEFYSDTSLDYYSRSQQDFTENFYLDDLVNNLIYSSQNSIGLKLYRKSIQEKFPEINHPIYRYIDYLDQLDQIKNTKITSKVGSNTDSFRESELLQALEELKRSNFEDDDFQNFMQEDYLGNFSTKYINYALNENEIFLSFYDDPLLPTMIVYNKDKTFVVPLVGVASNSLNITVEIDDFLEFTQSDGYKPNDFDKEVSSIFHDITIGFLEEFNFFRSSDSLDPVRKIYIHTTGELDNLPFNALYDSSNEKYLIEKYELRHVPDQLSFIMLSEEKKLNDESKFVGIGDPKLTGNSFETEFDNLFDIRGQADLIAISELASLPSTGQELKEISDLFSNSFVYLSEDARERSISDYLNRDADIISFATHAVENFSEETYEVGLVLTPPERNNSDDGILTRGEISKLNLIDKPTIVLSACNTSRGLFSGASKYSGLTSGFLEAGAGGLIVSSWDLETNSARDLSVLAHKIAIKEEISIGSGYRQAMIEFIRNPKYKKYSHPYFWAGFQTIGK